MNQISKRDIGKNAEQLACNYLKSLGYKIISQNFTIRGGEIDIICKDKEILVFIEVKARFSHEYGLPEESITPWKLKALKKTALFYNQKINWGDKPYRFDLLAIDFWQSNEPRFNLIKNITD